MFARGRSTISHKLHGHLTGLKPNQIHQLERLYRRTVPPSQVTTPELTSFLCECSAATRRQVGLVIDRKGHIEDVIVGDARRLLVSVERRRTGAGRLAGLRLLHTHLEEQGLSRDDLTDLTRLSLDLVAVVTMTDAGAPHEIELAHLVPPDPRTPGGSPWVVLPSVPWHAVALPFDEFVAALESEFRQKRSAQRTDDGKDRAIVVHVDDGTEADPESSIAELRELARTAGVTVVDVIVQRRRQLDPRFVLGRGKVEELMLQAQHREIELVIFDRDLAPAQVRAISSLTELKVIDRTQLILDIFAQRATSRAGKRRVELAQLKYTLPRLVEKDTAMSRLTGGIGGRGPGETKLEMNRRLAKNRIRQLEREIGQLSDERDRRRRLRDRRGLPVVGIVGYTNAGKSTLLNALTNSEVLAEDKLFATLDPTSRRLRFPEEREVIISDTVGFLRNLPPDLVSAFKATLEELGSADLLVHVVDAANPDAERHIAAVDRILEELGLAAVPRILAFNKMDRVESMERLDALCRTYDGLPISATTPPTLRPLLSRASRLLWPAPEAESNVVPIGTRDQGGPRDGVRTERLPNG